VKPLILVLSFSLCAILTGSVPALAAVGNGEKSVGKVVKSQKAPKRRLSLVPKLCVEQFVEATPVLTGNGSPAEAGTQPVPPTTVPAERLRVTTEWGVQPFVGSTLATPVKAPERNPEPGGAVLPGSSPLCQLDAGVSYSLTPGTSLNLGYRLPSSAWSSMLGSLGEETEAPTGKKVSVGISVDF
jgi:hypothetical protein